METPEMVKPGSMELLTTGRRFLLHPNLQNRFNALVLHMEDKVLPELTPAWAKPELSTCIRRKQWVVVTGDS